MSEQSATIEPVDKVVQVEPKKPREEKARPLKSLKEYFSQLYLIFCNNLMVWFLAYDDHVLIKYWYSSILVPLLSFRTVSFVKKRMQFYLIEMCYFINVLTLYVINSGRDIRVVYPFLHGPLAFYTLVYGDALIYSDLAKSTTFAIHSGGSVVSRRLYWNGDPALILTLKDFTIDSFNTHFKSCVFIYFCWAIPYYIWFFSTDDDYINMAKYTFGLKATDVVPFYLKLKYVVLHFLCVSVTLAIGIFSMHCEYFNIFIVGCQIASGFVQGAAYDFTGHRINFFKLFTKAYLHVKTEMPKLAVVIKKNVEKGVEKVKDIVTKKSN
jgi:uncharacterized membrane protein SpoIIM required for sporulation